MKRKLLTCSGAGKVLDVTPATVRQMERSGQLKAFRTEEGWRLFDKSAVEALARERARKRQLQQEPAQG
jgi:DNA-binding transcriptional MerR regulator